MNKKTFICTLIVSLFAFAQLAMADYTVMATGGGSVGAGPWSYGNGSLYGGEFTFTTGGLDTTAYVNTTTNQGGTTNTFQTFCLETQVEYSTNTPYSAVLSNYSPMDGKALTQGAAWLYWQFATGQLQGYDYSNATSRTNSAGLLQEAIWSLMNQSQPFTNQPVNSSTNSFYSLASTTLGANLLNANNGQYNVYVLNLYTDPSHTTEAQDQLVLAGPLDEPNVPPSPTPIPAAAWLLGSGLMGLLGLKRRKE